MSESLASAFAQLVAARYTHARATVVMDHVVQLAKRVVPGASDAVLTVFDDGRPIKTASSDPGLAVLQHHAGPDIDVIAKMVSLHASTCDLVAWPEYAAALISAEIADVIVCPAALEDKRVVCLSVYSQGSILSDQAHSVAQILIDHTAGVIANALAFEQLEAHNSQLNAALKTREVISVAKGIIMQRERCNEANAFHLLAQTSQQLNQKVADVARHVVALTESRARLLREHDV